jgi:hypothetical protein
MLEHLSDWKIVVPVAGDTTSTNLDESIDKGVNETQQHDFQRISTSLDAHE